MRTPLLLSHGFRPLFLCAVTAGLAFVPWWMAVFFGLASHRSSLDPVAWHGHEMIFGLVGAAIGGFLLTAVANWTNRPPISGAPLALIVGGWLLPRVLFAIEIEPVWLLISDSLYWILLTGLLGREIIAAGNYRNFKVVVILAGFVLLTIAFHAGTVFNLATDTTRPAMRAAIMLVALLISLIGGRIVPAFTGNWLQSRRDLHPPAEFGHVDRAAFASTLLLAPAWTMWPLHANTGYLALLAGGLQLARLGRWQGHRTLAEPLLFALHAGYAWLGLGFLLVGTGALLPRIGMSAGLHALGVGAMTTMIMAVASRAALGHTSRPLSAGKLLSASFVVIHVAVLLRIAASFDMRLVGWSAASWTLAFILFTAHVAPLLFGPRRS